jgi:hypothetical protein
MASDIGPIAVTPPSCDKYEKYSDYLQDVVHFMEFLRRHPCCFNEQRPETGVSKPGDFPSNDWEITEKISITCATPPESETDRIVTNDPVNVPALSQSVEEHEVDSSSEARVDPVALDKLKRYGLLSPKERNMLATIGGREGALQVGKKATKARLKLYCSDNLVEELIGHNRISRTEEQLAAVEKQLRKAQRVLGRKLDKNDLRKPEKLTVKPDPFPGHATYEDYAALWESSESDS